MVMCDASDIKGYGRRTPHQSRHHQYRVIAQIALLHSRLKSLPASAPSETRHVRPAAVSAVAVKTRQLRHMMAIWTLYGATRTCRV